MEKLADQLEQMETARRDLRQLLDAHEPDALRRPPAAGKWSILQIIAHLVDAEERSVAGVRRNLARTERLKTGLVSRLKNAALRTFFALDIPVKAPAAVAEIAPTESLELEELFAAWDKARSDWAALAKSVTAEQHREALFTHPVAGRLSFSQALEFQSYHAARHIRQIRSILGA